MTDLVKLMEAQYKKIMLDFEFVFSAEQVSHSAERGRLLEETLRKFLIAHLPKRIGIGTGQIAEAHGKMPSKQMDIVLYDSLNYPLLLNEGNYQIFPNEGVVSTIEVKSVLNKKSLKESVENVSSAKSLKKRSIDKKFPNTLGIIFSYRSWKQNETFLKNVSELTKNIEISQRPDLICSLIPGYILASTDTLGNSINSLSKLIDGQEIPNNWPSGKYILIQPFEYGNEQIDLGNEKILLFFYLILLDYINSTMSIGVAMSQYMSSPRALKRKIVDLENL